LTSLPVIQAASGQALTGYENFMTVSGGDYPAWRNPPGRINLHPKE